MTAEFDLIDRIRARAAIAQTEFARADVLLGIGDDAAILRVPAGHDLVVSTDTLNSGVHFPVQTAPFDIGWKSLAVNLSDLAAMGAQPAWCTLNLTMPAADAAWLDAFLDGFLALATEHAVALIGGDTTRGPLSISVTVHGWIPDGMALLRSGAKVGDDIWISGTLGDAAAGLSLMPQSTQAPLEFAHANAMPYSPPRNAHMLLTPSPLEGEGLGGGGASDCQAVEFSEANDVDLQHQRDKALQARLNRPTPRVLLGIALRQIATACIDVSDGLIADLGHVVDASNVGAEITVGDLPTSIELSQAFDHVQRIAFQLSGGDDYELCFTASAECASQVVAAGAQAGVVVTRIGRIEAESGLRLRDGNGVVSVAAPTGYRHFAPEQTSSNT